MPAKNARSRLQPSGSSKTLSSDSSSEVSSSISKAGTLPFHEMGFEIDLGKLKKVLDQFGAFPDKYRLLAWKELLQLPLDRASFRKLALKEPNDRFSDFSRTKPAKVASRMQNLMSQLTEWCPLVPHIEFLPQALSNLAKVIPDPLLLLEVSMALIVFWQQHWYEAFPSPPVLLM